jgi:hypothetical protein
MGFLIMQGNISKRIKRKRGQKYKNLKVSVAKKEVKNEKKNIN